MSVFKRLCWFICNDFVYLNTYYVGMTMHILERICFDNIVAETRQRSVE